ncbi:MAG: alkaline phosphatase family protein [Candidatus Woesearchaeota archaeon]
MRKRYIIYLVILVVAIFSEHQFLVYREGEAILDRMIAERDNNATRVYLLLIDAADPKIINYLIDKGQLPNFKRLKEEGAYGELQSFAVKTATGQEIFLSLPIIATIFTGVSPEEHGMTSHLFMAEGPEYFYPFKDIKSKTVWQIASENGRSVGIVGIEGEYPVERLNGFVVSGEYFIREIAVRNVQYGQGLVTKAKFPLKRLVSPTNLNGVLEDLDLPRIDAAFRALDIDYDFPSPVESKFRQSWERTLKNSPKEGLQLALQFLLSNKTAYYVFARDYQPMQVAGGLYSSYKPELFVEYLPGMDYFGIMYNTDEYADRNDLNNAMFQYYRFFDEHLGRIMNAIDNNAVLLVVSDHGVKPSGPLSQFNLADMKSDKGIFLAYGKGIEKGLQIQGSVYDVAPTTLDLLRLPIPQQMKGKVTV